LIDEPWGPEEEEAPPEGRHRRGQRRLSRQESDATAQVEPERRRWLVLAVVSLSLVGAGVASSSVRPSNPAELALPVAAAESGLPIVVAASAVSSAWYCPGPLPVGGGSASELVLVSTATSAVSGQVTIAGATGAGGSIPVTVPAKGEADVPVLGPGGSGFFAASVLLDGGGIGVTQVVTAYGVTTNEPCAVTTSASWYFPAGSTAIGANTQISLFNPTATPAVASLQFSPSPAVTAGPVGSSTSGKPTSNQAIAPPAFQGLTVGPGQVAVLDVGKQVQLKAELAASVVVTSGRLVAGEWSRSTVAGRPEGGLVEGAPQARSSWWFPLSSVTGATAKLGVTGYWLFNPGSSPARIELLLSLGAGATSSMAAIIPPASLLVVAPPMLSTGAGGHRRAAAGFAEVVSLTGAVVVARGIFPLVTVREQPTRNRVLEPAAVGAPQVTLGAPAAGASWLMLPDGVPPAGPARRVKVTLVLASPAVATTGREATVDIFELHGSGGLATAAETVEVQAGQVVQIPLSGVAATGALLLVSSGPVVAERDYAGEVSLGSLSSMAIPVD
jgi:hypothetical protein